MTRIHPAARHVREMDRLPDDAARIDPGPIDTAPLLGRWSNTNANSWGIVRAELTDRDGRLWMHVWGVDPPTGETHDWGEVPVERLYTDGPFGNLACGYIATFDLGHAETRIEANTHNGVTVLAAFTTFTDGSGRISYLSREFYHRRG